LDLLLAAVEKRAHAFLPAEDALTLNRRQARHLAEAHASVLASSGTDDAVLSAEHLRHARAAFDRLTGRAGMEEVLDALFGRFCLGK
jgi:tRNA modification GTPase